MKFNFKNKTKEEKTRIIAVTVMIIVFVLVAVLAPVIFPGSQFALIIDNSIGKFFNVAEFFANNYVTILESIAVVLFMWIIYKVLTILITAFIKRGHRSETIGKLMISSIKYAVVIVSIFLVLSAWNVQTPTLLAGAGILALAISFGAQSLIEDIFAGLFIIFEKQFAVGDVVQIEDFRGVVKELGLRITKFEDINGDIKMINNSDIRGAINSSNVLSQAICEIDISYNQDIKKFEEFMRDNVKLMKDQISTVKKGPFYDGIEKFGESGITIRVVAWSKEIDRLHTIRELNKHIKMLFDENNIEIPFPQMVVHNKKEN